MSTATVVLPLPVGDTSKTLRAPARISARKRWMASDWYGRGVGSVVMVMIVLGRGGAVKEKKALDGSGGPAMVNGMTKQRRPSVDVSGLLDRRDRPVCTEMEIAVLGWTFPALATASWIRRRAVQL